MYKPKIADDIGNKFELSNKNNETDIAYMFIASKVHCMFVTYLLYKTCVQCVENVKKKKKKGERKYEK